MRNKVWVYRNLKHGRKARPLYSIMRNGRVIARRHRVLLTNVKFVVREGGRQRTIKTGVKNVHAFAVGDWVQRGGAFGIDHNGKDLPAKIVYNPLYGPKFYSGFNVVAGAWGVLLNENGMSGTYLE